MKLCHKCGMKLDFIRPELVRTFEGKSYCFPCWNLGNPNIPLLKEFDKVEKPSHYHTNGMDTFEFLEKGFAPAVARGFYIGNIVKYVQRFELKNGLEDLQKARKYLDTLIDFVEKPS